MPLVNQRGLENVWQKVLNLRLKQFIWFQCQVKRFWTLMALDGTANAPGKIGMHADAWGVRKLMSHCLRSLRLGRVPRVLGLIGNLHSISYWGFNGIGMVIYGRLIYLTPHSLAIRMKALRSSLRSSELLGAWRFPVLGTLLWIWMMRTVQTQREFIQLYCQMVQITKLNKSIYIGKLYIYTNILL